MPFIIDGHNLIAALPDIALDDPDDEGKLVLKLRGWAAHENRHILLVFDGGMPGGFSRELSSGDLEVVFAARQRSTADRVIMERLSRLPDAPNWTVVSSDYEVLDAATAARARTETSQDFAARFGPLPAPPEEKPERVAPAEVAEWLEVFEPPAPPAPREKKPPRRPEPRPAAPPVAGPPPPPPPPPPGRGGAPPPPAGGRGGAPPPHHNRRRVLDAQAAALRRSWAAPNPRRSRSPARARGPRSTSPKRSLRKRWLPGWRSSTMNPTLRPRRVLLRVPRRVPRPLALRKQAVWRWINAIQSS